MPLVLLALATGLTAQKPRRTTVVTGGYVFDQGTRKPAVGADVWMVRSTYPGLPESLQRFMPARAVKHRSTKTDERGRFRFDVPFGEVVAFLAAHGGRMSIVSKPDVAGGYVSMAVHGTREVSGTIRHHGDGRPVPGQEVQIYLPADAHQTFGFRFATKTDAKGRYRARVPMGTWARVQSRVAGEWLSCDVHENVVNDFVVGNAGQSLPGRIVGSTGRPWADCLVIDRDFPRHWARTDDAGDFQVVRRGAIGFVFAFPPDNHAALLHFGPRQRSVRTTPGDRLKFCLVDGAGRPHRSVTVVIAGIASRPHRHRAGLTDYVIPRRYRSDAAGVVEVFCQKSCRYLAAFAEVDGRFVWFFRGAPKVGGDVGRLVVAPRGRVTGQVVAPDKQPVPGVQVHLVREPDDGSPLLPPALRRSIVNLPLSVVCRTGRAGRFHFPVTQPGRYRIVVRVPNCLPYSERIVVAEKDQFVKLMPPERCVVRGQVVGPGGEPVPGVMVQVIPDLTLGIVPEDPWLATRFGMTSRRSQTGSKGRFRFYGLPDRDVVVRVMGGAKWHDAQVRVPRGERERIVMRIKPKL